MNAPMHGLEHELRQHAGALRALALRLVGPAHADDLVQETSLLAWTQRPDERGGLGGWLRSVLRHRAGKLQRGEARRAQREQHAANERDVTSPADVAAQREAMVALHGALMALPAPYQGVLLQRFFQDLTPTAIAATTGVALATVKSRLQRGLLLLRERLDGTEQRGRRDWRSAFARAFALPRTAAPAVAISAGAMMSTKIFWIGGAAAAALACVVLWPDTASTALPARGASDVAAVAAAATTSEAVGAAPERREVAVAPTERAAAPLRMRVVDAFDKTPLPEFWVRLERGDVPGHTMTRSDEHGELEIDGAFRDQQLSVIGIDDPRFDRDLTDAPRATITSESWRTVDGHLDVPFDVGPTYRLLFDGAPPDANLEAALIAGNNASRAEHHVRQPVRAGEPAWVRLAASNANPTALGDGPWTLVVFGRAWMAAGPVQQVRGAQATPVMLRGCACGILRVEATVDGEPVGDEDRAHASVYALDKGAPVNAGGRTIDLGRAQSHAFELPIGQYRVFVGGPDRQVHREDITIAAAATTVVRASFLAGAQRLTLQVVLKSQTGTRQVGDLPVARHVGGSERVHGRWLRHREDGANLYELAGLLAGEWDVTIGPTPHLPPWDATTKRVRADAGALEFVCLDAGAPPPGHSRLRVVDGTTKQAIGGAGITTVLDGMHHMGDTDASGIGTLGPCLAGTSVRVLVRAAGYAPAWFEVMPVDTAEPPPHEVALHAGWGTLLMVVRPSTDHSRGEPLPGVRVLVDGVLAGTTDARGFFLLSTTTRPARIELQHDDYVHHYGGIDAATGTPDSQAQAPFFAVMKEKGTK